MRRYSGLIAILLALIGAGVVITASEDDDGNKKVEIIIAPTNPKVDQPAVQAPLPQVQAAANGAEDVKLGPGVDTPRVKKMSNAANPNGEAVGGPVPLASAHQAGCASRFNRYNFSYRSASVRPSIGVLHLPVAHNVSGWGDVSGVHIFLDRPSTAASTNYQNDDEGHCIYSVPETLKAWGQANYNGPTACSVEQQGYGDEQVFIHMAGPGMRQLARIFHDCFKRWNIKLQIADVDGRGGVRREGLTSHIYLGAAGGGHVDISPFGPNCVRGGKVVGCLAAVLKVARSLDHPVKPISDLAKRRCRVLRTLYPWKSLNKAQKAKRARIKASFKKYGVKCLKSGKARRR